MNIAALCTSSASHQLDHLAPLATLLNIPLYLTDPHLYQLSQHYYPQASIFFIDERDCDLQFISQLADLLIVSCKHWAKELSISFKTLYNKHIRFCYAPHGNSDKGWLDPQKDLLRSQDLSFIYGDHMKEMLLKRGVLNSLQGFVVTGNYRSLFYKKYQDFYDPLVEKEVFSLFEKKQPILLYAPTWQDPEQSSSFFHSTVPLIESLPHHFNLLVKLHPNLERDDPARVYSLIGRYENKKNVVFLTEYPLVFPLLNRVKAYIGDFSSVGYDFLTFNRPLFFINKNERNPERDPGLSLFSCGHILNPLTKDCFETLEKLLLNDDYEKSILRKKTYMHAFNQDVDFSTVKTTLINLAKKTFF